MNDKHLFPYEWYLRDGYPAKCIKQHGCKVFGTFICGGAVLWGTNSQDTTTSVE